VLENPPWNHFLFTPYESLTHTAPSLPYLVCFLTADRFQKFAAATADRHKSSFISERLSAGPRNVSFMYDFAVVQNIYSVSLQAPSAVGPECKTFLSCDVHQRNVRGRKGGAERGWKGGRKWCNRRQGECRVGTACKTKSKGGRSTGLDCESCCEYDRLYSP
jgi:hypothetical protein